MNNNMQDLEELLKHEMRNVERPSTMMGTKPTMRLSKEMLLSVYHQQLLQSKSTSDQFTVCNSIITLTYAPSTEPLSSLQRISLTELVLETVHRGKYALFKTLAESDKSVGIRTVIENPEGNVDIFSMYNYALNKDPSDVLPIGVIIALKEPYYKVTASGGSMLRCDHPQNVVYLDVNDPLIRQITWKSGLQNSDLERKILSFDEYRLKGNEFFKQSKFYDAVATYTRGLTFASSDSNSITLRLNRTAALLKLEHYEAALEDCRRILELNARNEKTLYRASKAFYALEEYEQAMIKQQLYAKVAANKDEAANELIIIRDRLNEKQHGIYDWDVMINEAKKSSTPYLDHVSYVGPVRIVNIFNGKGRGLVLTQDVRKGELLLCSKAFQVCYPSEADFVTYINMETKMSDKGAQGMISHKIIQKLINNPSLAKAFFDLYAGKHRLAKIPPITSTPPVIDAFWVGDICSMNAFGLVDCDLNPREDQNITFRYDKLSDSASAIFLMPSYINHACLGNCVRSFIGDIMIVRALDNLPAGTELLMTYTDVFWDFEERQSAITKHGFICTCRLCELDQTETKDVRNRRKAAFEMFQCEIFSKMKQKSISDLRKKIEEAEGIMNRIKKTYEESNRKQLQISFCPQLMVLAKLYFSNGNMEKCIQTYMKIMKIHGFSTKESTWTACLFPAMLQLCLMYYMTGNGELGKLWLEKLRAELCITATGDDRVFLKEYREVFERFGVRL